MELDDLKGLIELLKDTDITDIQIEKDGLKIRLKREKGLLSAEVVERPAPSAQGFPAAALSAQAASASEATNAEAQRLVTVTAPLVGTFYRSPSPDSASFAETGARVKKGQVLCIIEAMKLMNEIESEVDGVLVKALVENAHPVEYGEPLFLIEPV